MGRYEYWKRQYAKVKKPRKPFEEWTPQIKLLIQELARRRILRAAGTLSHKLR